MTHWQCLALALQNASAWHLSYHEGQHYNSVRLADDFEAGPPRPIPVVDGKVVASSHLSAAAIEWERERVSQVSRGTGCVDEGAIAQVLADAMGDVEQVSLSTLLACHNLQVCQSSCNACFQQFSMLWEVYTECNLVKSAEGPPCH